MEKVCVKAPGNDCAGLFCSQDRKYLGLTIQQNGNEEVVESFCVSTWSPDQFAALRAFINGASESSPVSIEDLKRISHRPARIFHVLHSLFGAEGVKRFYTKHTIKAYRKQLRDAGFDYPARPVPTGPKSSYVFTSDMRDLAMSPSRPRRSLTRKIGADSLCEEVPPLATAAQRAT